MNVISPELCVPLVRIHLVKCWQSVRLHSGLSVIVNTLSAECNRSVQEEFILLISPHIKHVTHLLFQHCQNNCQVCSGLAVTIKTKWKCCFFLRRTDGQLF